MAGLESMVRSVMRGGNTVEIWRITVSGAMPGPIRTEISHVSDDEMRDLKRYSPKSSGRNNDRAGT